MDCSSPCRKGSWLVNTAKWVDFRKYILVIANRMYSKLFCIFTLLKKIAYSSVNHNNNSSETSWSVWLAMSWKFTCNYAQVSIFYVQYVNAVIYSSHWNLRLTFNFFYFPFPGYAGCLEIFKISLKLDPFLTEKQQRHVTNWTSDMV